MRLHRPTFASVLLAVLLLAGASSAGAQGYPRLGLYGSMYSEGFPLWDLNGVLNPTVLDQIARYDEVVLDASPITPYRPDAALALRVRNPRIKLLALVTGHLMWFSNSPDSTVDYPTRYWRTIRDMDAFLYNTYGEIFGTRHDALANVNLAKHDASGHYVVAEALAALFQDAVVSTGIWDGIFIDIYCDDIGWMEIPTEKIDVVRAGYPNIDAFRAGWKAASDTLAARLRRTAGPNYILVGNCGQGTKYAWFNGWMREGFPYQNGGTWSSNMFRDPGGYFIDETRWKTPRSNYIFSGSTDPGFPYSAENNRIMRFGLGSATLADGLGVFGPASRNSRPEQFMSWWYDEYGVDLVTGAASGSPANTGWLGQPLGPYYQMTWVTAGPDAVPNPTFETDVTTGWQFFSVLGATATRDTTSAPQGTASVHITGPAANAAVPWSTAYSALGSLTVVVGQQYSATFWAKAKWPRAIQVSAGYVGGGGSYALQNLSLDTQWRRYQVILVPLGTGPARLDFQLAGELGDVWLDDVHFQAGAHSVFRRDFQNGTVLVNPGDTQQDVVLERQFRRITGVSDPITNNGTWSATQSVGAWDARFLIGSDATPPAAVLDLHPAPPGTAATRGAPARDPH